MPGAMSITATSCRAYGFGSRQPHPSAAAMPAYQCHGVPVRANGSDEGEEKPSNAQLDDLLTRLPANRCCPKNRPTPWNRPADCITAFNAPATFAAASDSILPKGCCAPVNTTGLPKSVSAYDSAALE